MSNLEELKKLFNRAISQTSIFQDADKYTERELAEYQTNCEKIKQLYSENLLDYRGTDEEFIKKYTDLLVSYHSAMANNPSWLVTGRGNLNARRYEKGQDSIHSKLVNLNEIIARLNDKNVEKMRQKLHRKNIMPESYAKKAAILENLLKIIANIGFWINRKQPSCSEYFEGLSDILRYDEMAREANIWYQKSTSNRRIPVFFWDLQKAQASFKETQHFTKDYWLSLDENLHHGIMTRTGKISNKIEKDLKEKIIKLKLLADKYDTKETI